MLKLEELKDKLRLKVFASLLVFMRVNECTNLVALVKYFEYVKSLSFPDEPNYELTKKIFREELIKMNEEQKPFDWLI